MGHTGFGNALHSIVILSDDVQSGSFLASWSGVYRNVCFSQWSKLFYFHIIRPSLCYHFLLRECFFILIPLSALTGKERPPPVATVALVFPSGITSTHSFPCKSCVGSAICLLHPLCCSDKDPALWLGSHQKGCVGVECHYTCSGLGILTACKAFKEWQYISLSQLM